jgi:hypothetical protein
MTSGVRGRVVALGLGLLVVVGVVGFEATHHAVEANSHHPASSFIEQQDLSIAPAEAAPTESGLSRSHHPPALAFFLIVGCALAVAVRRRREPHRFGSRRRLEQFFALRRGPPPALLVR